MKQTLLWDWQTIRFAHLVAVNHPRPTYYKIWLEKWAGRYRVRKQSGVEGWKPDKRAWEYDSLEKAEKVFDRTIKTKTNSSRKSKRIYRLSKNEIHADS